MLPDPTAAVTPLTCQDGHVDGSDPAASAQLSPRSHLRQQLKLTPVEETAAHVGLFRWRASEAFLRLDGTPYFDGSYDKALANVCIPPAKQVEVLCLGPRDVAAWMGIRTAEIDEQLLLALKRSTAADSSSPDCSPSHPSPNCSPSPSHPRQVVIVGAGLDTRPWRLPLGGPGRCRVVELDSGAVERVKLAVLGAAGEGAGAVGEERGREEGGAEAAAGGRAAVLRLTQCERVFAPVDLAQREQVLSALSASGHDPARPAVFLLEGLIGYLTPAQGAQLLSALRCRAAPGSTLLMSAPPTQEMREEAEARGRPLRHVTFEKAEETMARARAAGWVTRLLSAAELGIKYGVPSNRFGLIVGTAE
ncbi:hypothetical protein Agub_g725 [Astrephomene gubernaculifera]|uniref:S-adenosyl-L-methionine-dependent methyltransferase n=1 Tax=Astrephomene gubernaculifera TaxID=47775 RepID=A0AAD3DEK5_9CHLO|nr:hypothetical protein Agub_g725 [Astrephomene gubernaculifera]